MCSRLCENDILKCFCRFHWKKKCRDKLQQNKVMISVSICSPEETSKSRGTTATNSTKVQEETVEGTHLQLFTCNSEHNSSSSAQDIYNPLHKHIHKFCYCCAGVVDKYKSLSCVFFAQTDGERRVGLGVRSGPCHVQTVEPHGPAAVAGIKVGIMENGVECCNIIVFGSHYPKKILLCSSISP